MTEEKPNSEHPNVMVGAERESEPLMSIDYPVVRKKFRVTIDVDATLAAAGPRGGELPPAPQNVAHIRALMEGLLAQPELVERLLRLEAVEATKQVGRALEVEHGEDRVSEQELLAPIFAALEPEARAYFTEEVEDGASEYYFDGYRASVERVSMIEIIEE